MIDVKSAAEIAKDVFLDVGCDVTIKNARRGKLYWYFGAYDEFGPIPDCSPIAVDFETGKTSFPMPSLPYFVSGLDPTPEEIDYENAVRVEIPEE